MSKKIIFIVLIIISLLGISLYGKINKVVQADKYNFSKKRFDSKTKYVIKTAIKIININRRTSQWKRKISNARIFSDKKILLLGASISQHWIISEYFDFIENLAVYKFDKRLELNEYIDNVDKRKKVDAIILKECAAFINSDTSKFLNDFKNLKEIYKEMIQIVNENGITPIITTIAPVTYEGTHLDNILKFNDWVRIYANNNNIMLMDIEKSLRISESDRRLRSEISQEDGLHLNRSAYEEYLNPLVLSTCNEVFK